MNSYSTTRVVETLFPPPKQQFQRTTWFSPRSNAKFVFLLDGDKVAVEFPNQSLDKHDFMHLSKLFAALSERMPQL